MKKMLQPDLILSIQLSLQVEQLQAGLIFGSFEAVEQYFLKWPDIVQVKARDSKPCSSQLHTVWFSAAAQLSFHSNLSQKAVLWCTFPVLPPQRASCHPSFLYLSLSNIRFAVQPIQLAQVPCAYHMKGVHYTRSVSLWS